MEIKEHLYFRSQKVTISGVFNYIIRSKPLNTHSASNSLNTYNTSNSFNKHDTGDPLEKETMAGALEEKMAGVLEEKAVDLEKEEIEEKVVDFKKKKKGKGDKGERHNGKKTRRK